MNAKAKIVRQPKLASPREVNIEEPRSLWRSRRGSGLCSQSSSSGNLASKFVPHVDGSGASEYLDEKDTSGPPGDGGSVLWFKQR
jgi:hypothetical protein